MTTHTITTADNPIVFDGSVNWKGAPVVAGDIIEIEVGTYADTARFENITGTLANPIIIRNKDGVASFTDQGAWCVIVENCDHTHFEGNNHAGTTYGLRFTNRFKIHDNNTHIQLRWFEVDTSPGIGIHIDQNDSPLVDITDILIEDGYIHDCTGEPIYAGSNRNLKASNEHILRRVTIRRIITEDCAEGPNINSTLDGWEISNCTAIGHRPDADTAHNAGISIGKGASAGNCFENRIIDCSGMGIAINNGDNIELNGDVVNIYRNIIHNVGHWTGTNPRTDGIKQSNGIPTLNIYNNTVSQVGNGTNGHGIRVVEADASVYDNISIECTQDGISLGGSVPAGNAFNNLSKQAADSVDGIAHTSETLKFVDYAGDDFHIESDSPAIGQSSTGEDIGRWQFSETSGGGSTTVELEVTASSDDARQLTPGGMNISDTGHTINDDGEYLGYRFQNATIPQGSTITAAVMQISVTNTTNDDPDVIITGEDIDDAPTFTTTSLDIANRTDTTAQVTWQDTAIGTGFKTLPDLSTIIQEIVNRPGWASGNAIVIMLKQDGDTGALRSDTFDKGSQFAAQLDITYTAPAGTQEMAVKIQDMGRIESTLTDLFNLECRIEDMESMSLALTDTRPITAAIRDLDYISASLVSVQNLSIAIRELADFGPQVQNIRIAIRDLDRISADLSSANEMSIAIRDMDSMAIYLTRRHNRALAMWDIDGIRADLRNNQLITASIVDGFDGIRASMDVADNLAIAIRDIETIQALLTETSDQQISIAIRDIEEIRSLLIAPQTHEMTISIVDISRISAILSIYEVYVFNFKAKVKPVFIAKEKE